MTKLSGIRQLVDEVNRDRRSDGHATVLSFIKLDEIGLTVLAEQGFTPDSTPSAGTRVLIRRNGNLSTGGTATEVTPGLRMHLEPSAGTPRAVGRDIVEMVFPSGQGRIPIAAVTGVNGKALKH